jgi:hypothetical protein
MTLLGRVSASKLPSLGFALVVLVNLGLVVFLAWGFRRPPLDRVWELHHALKIGKLGTLDSSDQALLLAAMARHRRLAEALLSEGHFGLVSQNSRGWLETPTATVLKSADAPDPCVMRVEARLPEQAFPVHVDVSGAGFSRRLTLGHASSSELGFPNSKHVAELFEVKTSVNDVGHSGGTFGVHLSFRCAQGRKAR